MSSLPAGTHASLPFEVVSAVVVGGVIGVLGTCLEYCRRGFILSFGDVAGNLDDYVTSGLLLLAAWFAVRARPYAMQFLVLAWAYCTSLMFSSSLGQIQDTLRGRPEPDNTIIVLGKLAILTTCVASLVLAFRRAR